MIPLQHVAEDEVPLGAAGRLHKLLAIDHKLLVTAEVFRVFENLEEAFKLLVVLDEVARKHVMAGPLDNTQHAEHPDYEPDLNFKKAKAEVAGEQAVAHLKAEILLVTRASRPLRSFGFAP
jgi:hypothetical protein